MAGLDAWACVQPLPGRTGQLTCALLRAGAGVLRTPGGGAHPAVGTLFGRAERQRQATPNGGDRAHLLTWPPSTIPSEGRPGSLPPPPHVFVLERGEPGLPLCEVWVQDKSQTAKRPSPGHWDVRDLTPGRCQSLTTIQQDSRRLLIILVLLQERVHSTRLHKLFRRWSGCQQG